MSKTHHQTEIYYIIKIHGTFAPHLLIKKTVYRFVSIQCSSDIALYRINITLQFQTN